MRDGCFDDRARPIPCPDDRARPIPCPDDRTRAWMRDVVLPLCWVGCFLLGGWLLIRASTLPISPGAPPIPPIAAPSSSANPFPPELIRAAVAISTFTAPTPTPLPPTPTYAMATEVPPLVCGSWVQKGTVCEMPQAEPTPTPTPPLCPVTPMAECRWTGRAEDAVPVDEERSGGSPT